MKLWVHQTITMLIATCITALSGALVYEDLVPRGRWEHLAKVALGVLALLALRFPWRDGKPLHFGRSPQTRFPDEEKNS